MTDLRYELASESPLVVLADTGGARHVDDLAEQLARDFGDQRFIAVVAAEHVDDIDAPLAALGAVLAELIFTASTTPPSAPGMDLALRALEVVGIGQDFVFTVPALPDAIRYGMDALADRHGADRDGADWDGADRDAAVWEGTALLVLAPQATSAWPDTGRAAGRPRHRGAPPPVV